MTKLELSYSWEKWFAEMQKRCLIRFNIHSWFQNEKLLSKLRIKEKFLKKMMSHSIKTEDSSVHKCSPADFVSVKGSISPGPCGGRELLAEGWV